MLTPRQPIKLQRDVKQDGQIIWHLSDNKMRTIFPFLDYVIQCSETKLYAPKTIEGIAYSLKKWYQYLSDSKVDALDADDKLLEKFRSHLLDRETVNRCGDQQARKRTANVDIKNVYGYYAWLQVDYFFGQNKRLLGTRFCQITSSLAEQNIDRASRAARRRYPLLFKNAGENSKHRFGWVPVEEHRALLTDYFYDTYPVDLAKRNCLIFDLAWSVGWRRASILSLTVDQFSDALVLTSDDVCDIQITPPSQKFGYSNSFTLERNLATRVLHYIEHERAEIVSRTGSSSSAVFLSKSTGKPITQGSVSLIFNKARISLGWPRGASLHGWRRGFANKFLEREIDARVELGLDTGGESVGMALANALGQESLKSQGAYLRNIQSRLRASATFRDKAENMRLSDENASLRAEIAELRVLLGRTVL